MKLLLCTNCGDLFNLTFALKSCRCGQAKGKYLDNTHAVVNGGGVSIGIGNGSLQFALLALPHVKEDFRETTNDVYQRHPTALVAWLRPHTGPANSHTIVDKEL